MSVENASEFAERRERSDEAVLRHADLPVKRFFDLDQDVYEDGTLPKTTKELLGLVAPTVLGCDDGIRYHQSEVTAALGVAFIVGGAITIPHLRHADEVLESIASKE